MGIFTIISLMIGVFGATLSVIMSVKSFGDRRVDQAEEQVGEQITIIEGLVEDNEQSRAVWVCRKCRKVISLCGHAWRVLLFIPIAFFAFWAFSTAFYVATNDACSIYFDQLTNPDPNQVVDANAPSAIHGGEGGPLGLSKAPMLFQPWMILLVSVVDLVCIFAAFGFLASLHIAKVIVGWFEESVVQQATDAVKLKKIPNQAAQQQAKQDQAEEGTKEETDQKTATRKTKKRTKKTEEK